jgi:YegS/Rv2252/BmrU family lipid kinase
MPLQTNELSPRKKLLFVINPISGGKSKDALPIFIKKYLDHSKFEYKVLWWSRAEELQKMICPTVLVDYYGVVAVGGDGTINLIANYVKHSQVALGIIPMGSGNGLARSLGIPMNLKEAIKRLNTAKQKLIDLGSINGHLFVNVAGIGFDAAVSEKFRTYKNRGLKSYIKSVLGEYKKSVSKKFSVDWLTGQDSRVGFLMSIANGNQWGNDFYVAPEATLDDGILDVVVIQKPKWYKAIGLLKKIVGKKLTPAWSVTSLSVEVDETLPYHADGEFVGNSKNFHIQNMPSALAVLV